MEPDSCAVLIVDDEQGVHSALARTLRGEPYELAHAFDVAEARLLLAARPEIRAIVCDHYMPGELGLDFMLEVRRTRPELFAILLTAQADLGMVLSALDEGRVHRFYTKPWDGDEMRRDLRELLGLPAATEPARRGRGPAAPSARTPGSEADGWVSVIADRDAGGSATAGR